MYFTPDEILGEMFFELPIRTPHRMIQGHVEQEGQQRQQCKGSWGSQWPTAGPWSWPTWIGQSHGPSLLELEQA